MTSIGVTSRCWRSLGKWRHFGNDRHLTQWLSLLRSGDQMVEANIFIHWNGKHKFERNYNSLQNFSLCCHHLLSDKLSEEVLMPQKCFFCLQLYAYVPRFLLWCWMVSAQFLSYFLKDLFVLPLGYLKGVLGSWIFSSKNGFFSDQILSPIHTTPTC